MNNKDFSGSDESRGFCLGLVIAAVIVETLNIIF